MLSEKKTAKAQRTERIFDLLYLQPVHYASDSFLHQDNILRIEKEPHLVAKCIVCYYGRVSN